MKIVTVERSYLPEVTLSKITLLSGKVLYGCERPWENNAPNVSCIPEGQYKAKLVDSPLMAKLSGGKYSKAWRLQNVPNRSGIIFHVGNVPNNSEGCVLLGSGIGSVLNQVGVVDSGKAVGKFMEELSHEDEVIFWFKPWIIYN